MDFSVSRLMRTGPRLVSWLCAGLIAIECVRAIPLVLSGPAAAAHPMAVLTMQRRGPQAVDVTAITAAHLFGVNAEAPAHDPDAAPPSAANLLLVGTLASKNPRDGISLIAEDGSTNVYKVGDRIGDASLHLVYATRVILNRGGRLETLYLPRFQAAPKPIGEARQLLAPRQEPAPAAPAEVQPEPPGYEGLGEFVRAQASVDNDSGKLRGFVVHPVRNGSGFVNLGLRQNDLVTAVNGTPVVGQDPQTARDTLNSMLKSDHATVTVFRNGQVLDLSINTSD